MAAAPHRSWVNSLSVRKTSRQNITTRPFGVFPAKRVLESTGAGDDTGFVGYVLPVIRRSISIRGGLEVAEIIFMGLRLAETAR